MVSSTDALASARPTPSRWTAKHTLWLILGLLGISVIFSTEIPILFARTGPTHTYLLKLIHDRLLFIPHAICGVTATLIGPLQFSSRLRRKHLRLHRILGRVYVGAIFIAAPTALALAWASPLILTTLSQVTQAGLWMLCTLFAFITARNRHIAQHRQWMIRSYAVTFSFISTRALNFIPAYANLNDSTFECVIILITTFSAFVLPDIAFHWRELTTRRA
jgi:uncharacterized membrane protein